VNLGKVEYFPIKGPIPGSSRASSSSSSAAAQKPTPKSTRVYAILCIIYSIFDFFFRMACLDRRASSVMGLVLLLLISYQNTVCVCLMGYGQMSCLLDNAFDFPSFIQRALVKILHLF
jgi:hypothetical protein